MMKGSISFVKKLRIDTDDETTWDEAADWLHAESDRYEVALRAMVAAPEAASAP